MVAWFSVEISRGRAELATVATFTTTGNVCMHISKKCRRCKAAGIGVSVTLAAFGLCRDVIDLLGHRNTGVMAGRTIAVNDSRGMDKSTSECTICDVDGVARRAVKICLYMTKRLA